MNLKIKNKVVCGGLVSTLRYINKKGSVLMKKVKMKLQSVPARCRGENIWLTQKMLATVYDIKVTTINEHIKKIY